MDVEKTWFSGNRCNFIRWWLKLLIYRRVNTLGFSGFCIFAFWNCSAIQSVYKYEFEHCYVGGACTFATQLVKEKRPNRADVLTREKNLISNHYFQFPKMKLWQAGSFFADEVQVKINCWKDKEIQSHWSGRWFGFCQ